MTGLATSRVFVPSANETYSYDGAGNLVSTTYSGDTHGRLATITGTAGVPPVGDGDTGTTGVSPVPSNLFVYSCLLGTDLVSGYACGGFLRTVAYEPYRDLVSAITNRFGSRVISAFEYTNDAAGRRVAISRGGEAMGPLSGATDAYGYNGRNEVVSARRTLGGESVAGFNEDFAYDPIGNRISATDYDETGAARTSTYAANALNQYVSRMVPGWASVRGLADADATVAVNGNPAYMVGRAAPSAPNPDDLAYFFGSDDFDNSTGGGFAELEVSAVVSDGTNDLVSVTTNRVFVPPANEIYAYDADGNQTLVTTGTGAWQVEYNGENRPVRWTRISSDSPTPNSSTPTLISMAFDHQGRRRLYVEVAAGVTNKLHRFTYDDYVCIARNREVDAQHGIGSDAFVWDPTEPIATRPLMCDLSGGGALLYCHDGNKNVSEAVTPDGTIAAHYEYSSFGKVLLVSSENADQSLAYLNPYRFSSEYADDALGLVYYNYRHYNPRDGRWMSRDPIGDDGGVHLYAFCENNPLSCVDSLGYALANYIPVISTILSAIENSFGHIPGSLPSDYSFVSPKDCKCDIIAAENNCLAKVKTEAWKYLGDYATTALIARGLDVVITILTIKIPTVAAVFVADGLIGGAINVSAGTKIMEGASNAKKNNCDCSQHGY